MGRPDLAEHRNEKWTTFPVDVLPAHVAELDFTPPSEVRGALRALIDRGDLGYPRIAQEREVAGAFASHVRSQFGLDLDPELVVPVCDVLAAARSILEGVGRPGDEVLVQPPLFSPLFDVVAQAGRRAVPYALLDDGSGYRLPFDALESSPGPRTRVLISCNPQNPTGRVFRRDELQRLGRIANERDLLVISDEVFADFVFDSHHHVPFATLGPEVSRRTITLASAGKTFAFPGLPCGIVVFGDAVLRRRFGEDLRFRVGPPSRIAMEAATFAYRHGQRWLAKVRQDLAANRERLRQFVVEHADLLGCHPPEGTFLAWIDGHQVLETQAPGVTLGTFFVNAAKVGLSPGGQFRAQCGDAHARLNFGTPGPVLAEILARMGRALQGVRVPR